MKTPMQELMSELNDNSFQELFSNQNYIKEYLEARIKSTYIEKEKQVIKEAFAAGENNIDFPALHGQGKLSDQHKYYEQLYNPKTK